MTHKPISRFTVFDTIGILLVCLAAWGQASGLIRLPGVLPGTELAVIALGLAAALASGMLARLAMFRDAGLAAVVATALHLALYYLPLAVLMELPINRHSVAEIGAIAGSLLLGYTLATTAAVALNRVRRTTGGSR